MIFLDFAQGHHENEATLLLNKCFGCDEQGDIFISGMCLVDDGAYLVVIDGALQADKQALAILPLLHDALLVPSQHNLTSTDELLLLLQSNRPEHTRTP